MEDRNRIALKIFEGANLFVPFAAVVTQFTTSHGTSLAPNAVQQALSEILPTSIKLRVALGDEPLNFPRLVAVLTMAWQDLRGPNGLPVEIREVDARTWQLIVGFHDPDVATASLQLAMNMAEAIFRSSAATGVNAADLMPMIKQVVELVGTRQPDYIARALIRVARRRQLPVYSVAAGSNVWMYGQAARGFHFHEAANHRDALTAALLAGNKAASNHLVQRLGFPGVTHGIAIDKMAARQIARVIGYPLVVKPTRGGKGKGVTVDVRHEADLDVAFAKAMAGERNRVLIERFIEGDNYRLSVFGGKLMRASRFLPPHVIGDGRHSIADLVEAENSRRSDDGATVGDFLSKLTLDSEAMEVLGKQGFAPADRPPEGMRLFLRRNANLKTGGKLEDVTASIHPDNVAMAEAIARNFHLDAAGIDFITPDISKSWQSVACAVIEVNTTPGIGDFLAEKILLDKFPDGSDGRIPSVLIVGDQAALAGRVARAIAEQGKCVGLTDGRVTQIGGQPRFPRKVALPARIMCLLLETSCEALVVSCSASDIEEHGLPHTRYDVALIAETLSAVVRLLITNHSGQLIDSVGESTLDEVALPLIVTAINSVDQARLHDMIGQHSARS